MQRWRWWLVGVVGAATTAIALAMAWNFLTPPGSFEDLTAEQLTISVIDDGMSDPTSPLGLRVEHHVEAEWEYVFIYVSGSNDSSVKISVSPGSVETNASWWCATGIQALNGNSPPPFEQLGTGDDTWAVGEGFDPSEAMAESPNIGRATHSDGEGVTCQRTGPIFARKTQGLVLLAPAAVRSSLPHHVSATLSESMELPPSWELFGRGRDFSTSETFGQSGEEKEGMYSLQSSPDRATQTNASDAVGGLHLARDPIAESDEARLAWISALIGGAGVALLFSAAEHLIRRDGNDEKRAVRPPRPRRPRHSQV